MCKKFVNFSLGEVFVFKAIKQAKSQRDIPSDRHGIPYVVQSTVNNMVARSVNRQWLIEHNEAPVEGNAIVLGVTLPAVSYQPCEFGASQVITARNMHLNEQIGEYLVTVLTKHIAEFSYSKKPGMSIYKAMKIQFPVIESLDQGHEYTVDDIDWQYMQDRIAELEQDRIAELEAYLAVSGLDDYELTEEDKELLSPTKEYCLNRKIRFNDYFLGDLFVSSTGDVDLQQKDINGKGQFFINSGVDNRGIKGKTDKQAKIFPSNTITIDFWGNAYYRDFEYKMATHNHVFSLSGDVIKNRFVGLYIVSKLCKLPLLFSYNNMATWNKLKLLKISLPINSNNEIDYDYMEKYIRAIEKIVIADVVKYKDTVIATTKKVISSQK